MLKTQLYLTGFAFLFGRRGRFNKLREERGAGEEKVKKKRIQLLGDKFCGEHVTPQPGRGREKGANERTARKLGDLAIGASVHSSSVQPSAPQTLGGRGGSLRSRLGGSKESAAGATLLRGAEPARRQVARPGGGPPAGRSLWRCPRS